MTLPILKSALLNTLLILQLEVESIFAQENLLKNPSFEEPFSGDDWFCNGGCTMERVPGAHDGSFAAQLSNRQESWHAISQYVELEPDSNYEFTAWVKILNQLQGHMWHQVDLMLDIDYVDGTEPEYRPVGKLPYVKEIQGWQKASGDFISDTRGLAAVRVFIQIQDFEVDYLVDNVVLAKIPRDPDWKTKAQERIEEIRKENITINLSISSDYEPSEIELGVIQTKHHFAFGTAVKHNELAGSEEDDLKYQACFYENFEWAVPEYGLKWNTMEKERDVVEFPADAAIDALQANGVPVRGHTVFWGREGLDPEWLLPLEGPEILQEMTKRMDYVIPHYSEKLVHWDVNNEQLHGDWYENKTGDAYLLHWLFQEVRERDTDIKLFLNDYGIVNYSQTSQALVNSAEELLGLGADVQGLGIQSHLRGVQGLPEITGILKRLDVASTANLPLWITELDVCEISDATELAQSYEDAWTLYFSYPQVEGILIWGFHDEHHIRPECALFEGPDYVPNESGLAWQRLIHDTWKTNVMFQPSGLEETFDLRGFHGFYKIEVRHNGDLIFSEDLILNPGAPVTVDVNA